MQAASPVEDDHALIRRVAAGDESAFLRLYRRHQGPLFNYLLRLVGEPPVAEDLLQEVFLTLWEGADRFRGEAQVRTWLFRIGHYRAVSWVRRQQRARNAASLRPLEGDGVSEYPEPENRAIQSWRVDQVLLALQELSTKHRAVIELAFVHAFTYAEIAEILGCPVGTVKSRMSYALRRLDGLLSRMGVKG
jgi:RNA polymerase sigma-70 factor (ECF subfamily)